jgi:hypothetical protein
MSRSFWMWVAAIGLVLVSTPASAQTWKTVTSSRQVRGEDAVRVHVRFGAGSFTLHEGSAQQLYRSRVRYDADLFDSRTSFDPERGLLDVGVTPRELNGDHDADEDYPQELDLALSPVVPLTLDLEFGAAHAVIDLGGLSVASAHIKTGASGSVVEFSKPNRVPCDRLEIAVGAAEFVLSGLGNARCAVLDAAGGVGAVTFDFTGDWPRDFMSTGEITVGLGELTLRFPETLGVAIKVNRLFAGFEPQGFVKQGSRYVSTQYDEATARVELELNAVMGGIDVEWVPADR